MPSVEGNPQSLTEGIPQGLCVWSLAEEDAFSVKLAARLCVPLRVQSEMPDSPWVFFYDDGMLYLHSALHSEFQPIVVDYLGGEFARRWRSATRNDILAKAIGIKKGVSTICDATCGFGHDAFFLSTFKGVEITACERNPVAAELVIDALNRASDAGRFDQTPLYFHYGDAREFLSSRPLEFDAIYLDPMYPRPANATAKPKKEMLIFSELVGKDADSEALFEAAWAAAKKRVVVKRADDAPEITQARKPDYVVPGKTVRFDIYLKI